MTPDAVSRQAPAAGRASPRGFTRRLHRIYLSMTVGFLAFVGALMLAEQMGMSRNGIGLVLLVGTIALYASIGILSRTADPAEYYVAGRRVPAMYNGMATGADWMSAASFIGMAGTLYLSGYGGLAFILGWTGGYCLVALLLAPYLRRFGQYTIPDFLGARYGGNLPRAIGVGVAILVSFVYVVAQIYGIGLITASLTGLDFAVGVFVGLGGILVCSFLGGMRAVTWTQVAQYIILIIAFLIPVVWLSVKQTGVPLPQLVYGVQLEKVTALEDRLRDDPAEREVIRIFEQRAAAAADKRRDAATAMAEDQAAADYALSKLRAEAAPVAVIQAAERARATLPKTLDDARRLYADDEAAARARAAPLGGMPPHATPFAGDPQGDAAAQQAYSDSRRNFLALVFCLMVGTAALPHLLMRCYTTPSVKEARESVTWSLLFIGLLYLTAPALAVLVKFEIFNGLVGTSFDQLPAWVGHWAKVDPGLLSVSDVNGDGRLQLGELQIGGDIIVLATPEIAGLPYVIAGLVAAGGLAAALSTADGLLLTIANALSHDTYYKMIDPDAATSRRVAISKTMLLVVALAAAYIASLKVADILFLVGAAFSLAAAAFFPALVLGVFWRRANRWGASCGMVAGLLLTLYYMATTQPWLRGVFGVQGAVEEHTWFGIAPIAAGVFGVPLSFAVILVVSLLTPPPSREVQALVDSLRRPEPAPP